MRRLRLALLNASHDDENTSRNFRRELDADIVEFDVTAGQLPPSFEYDGFVVTGSASSVYDDEAWIDGTERWAREAVDRGLPALGICWGHQLLAAALGGEVEAMDGFELGYRTVERVGDSLLLEDLDDEFLVFTSHGDAVTELPPGAEPTARNDYSNHGFRRGDVFTVQFHPEYDTRTAREVTKKKDFLPDGKIERVLDGITEDNYARACEAKRLFERFTEYVRATRDGASDAAAAGDD